MRDEREQEQGKLSVSRTKDCIILQSQFIKYGYKHSRKRSRLVIERMVSGRSFQNAMARGKAEELNASVLPNMRLMLR